MCLGPLRGRSEKTMVVMPRLSPEQMKGAREAAARTRRARAQFKKRVRDRELTLQEALDQAHNDKVLAHVKVMDLLKCVPWVGEKRATEVRLDIPLNRRVRGLGRHQMAALKAEVL